MKARVLGAALAIAVTSIVFAACGSSGPTTVTEAASTEPATETTAPAKAEARIEKIEAETQEAELEAAEAKKEAAQQAARAKKAAAKEARQAAAQQAEAQSEESSSEPPDVIGMRLPAAEAELSAAGFKTLAENTDTTFGIMVPSHYTVCTETLLGGNTVEVLAQKYGC